MASLYSVFNDAQEKLTQATDDRKSAEALKDITELEMGAYTSNYQDEKPKFAPAKPLYNSNYTSEIKNNSVSTIWDISNYVSTINLTNSTIDLTKNSLPGEIQAKLDLLPSREAKLDTLMDYYEATGQNIIHGVVNINDSNIRLQLNNHIFESKTSDEDLTLAILGEDGMTA